MEKRFHTDVQSEIELVEADILPDDSLLPLEQAGHKETLGGLVRKKLEFNSSTGSTPPNSARKIKPVDKITILNDAVRQIILPDGSPAP